MKYKILTVDDSNIMRKIVKNIFSKYDCVIYESENGEDGLETAIEVKPDLVILDIDMPVMNGWDALASLRFHDSFAKTPVIMLSANSGEINIERAKKMGVIDFISKPFKGDHLLNSAKKVLDL